MKSKGFLKTLITVILLLALTGTVLTACGTSAPASETGDQTAQKTDTDAAAASTPVENNGETIKMVSYFGAPHPYYEDVKVGVAAFEKDYGIPVEKKIGPDFQQQSETENMEALAAKGVKYFSVYPSDPTAANGLFEELTKKGVKIVNFGASTVLPTTASFCVATDVKAAAMAATEFVIKQMGEKGNILNTLEVLSDANTRLRKEGVEEAVKKYPNVKIIQEVSDMKSSEEAIQKIGDAFAANGDKIDGIIATGNTTSVGVAQVIADYKSKGGTRVIHSIGIDTDPILMKSISDGNMEATIAQNTNAHGYISCLLLKYLSEGWTPREGQYFVDSGYVIVTKDNIDSYSADLDKVTQDIKASIETKYVEKK